MAAPVSHARPAVDGDLLNLFMTKVQAAAGTVEQVPNSAAVPAAVSGYLTEHNLPNRVALAPALESLPWPEALQIKVGPSQGDDPTSVTPCVAAVAETGSVVLLSSPESPTTLNFLPDDHIVLVRTNQIVQYLEDVWTILRERFDGLPRTVNFITGPSRTADVEQTIQLGAHGPRRLHVLLVASE
jgi:L-lactate dehydrogenase complex protein LldG